MLRLIASSSCNNPFRFEFNDWKKFLATHPLPCEEASLVINLPSRFVNLMNSFISNYSKCALDLEVVDISVNGLEIDLDSQTDFERKISNNLTILKIDYLAITADQKRFEFTLYCNEDPNLTEKDFYTVYYFTNIYEPIGPHKLKCVDGSFSNIMLLDYDTDENRVSFLWIVGIIVVSLIAFFALVVLIIISVCRENIIERLQSSQTRNATSQSTQSSKSTSCV